MASPLNGCSDFPMALPAFLDDSFNSSLYYHLFFWKIQSSYVASLLKTLIVIIVTAIKIKSEFSAGSEWPDFLFL